MSGKNEELELIEISQPVNGSAYGRNKQKTQKARMRRRAQQRKRRRKRMAEVLFMIFLVGVLCLVGHSFVKKSGEFSLISILRGRTLEQEEFLKSQSGKEEYPQELLDLAEKNEEALDFVKDYPNREKYKEKSVDLSQDYTPGEVPLLMQWDKRWGYDSYGSGMIGLEGCGPTCLTMAYLYFTGDVSMNPREMAEYACENGYYSPEGTSWSLWTEGVDQLGLSGEELSLSESVMKSTLDAGGLIVCSMRPGDFTTTGHYILIRGYDKNGFYVNDPNRRSNSERQWDYETLSGQIKNLWGIYSLTGSLVSIIPSFLNMLISTVESMTEVCT